MMKRGLITSLALGVAGCMVQPPPLPKQELPRQELPRQELPRPEIQPKASALTPGMVVKHIQKGKTTQADILEIFGPPDMITKSGPGEMWGYDKVSREVAEAATGARMGASTGSADRSRRENRRRRIGAGRRRKWWGDWKYFGGGRWRVWRGCTPEPTAELATEPEADSPHGDHHDHISPGLL